MDTLPVEVDLVYLWVDGDDPAWLEKKQKYSPHTNTASRSESNHKARYSDNNELRYALRSAEQHVPWIRQIFIVTDDQRPQWLDISHPRIKVVDHREILPTEILPSFNSTIIEQYLYRIPGLSEHFLYANDDMFFNADLTPGFFFAEDGCPIVRMKHKLMGKWHYRIKRMLGKKLGQYAHTLSEAARMIYAKFGVSYPGVPHHNVDSYRKSDFREAVEVVFAKEIEAAKFNRVRARNDVQRFAFSLYALYKDCAHLRYVGRSESSRILLYRHDFERYIKKYQPKLFCLNDNQHLQDHHRKQVEPILSAYFPVKAAFEI